MSTLELESMTVEEVGNWLEEKGLPEEIIAAFVANDMDGEAVSLAFASLSGPDCIKDIVSKYGLRLKVYQILKKEIEAKETSNENLDLSGDSLVMRDDIAGASKTGSITSSTLEKPCSSKSLKTKSTSIPTVTLKVEKCPDPFPIPRFREDTEKSLIQKRLADDDRRYMVRILATVLCTYVQKPSTHDYEIVAKSLLAKFPFLKEHDSWKTFLYSRCQNQNRPKKESSNDVPGPSVKRPKLSPLKHPYSAFNTEIEDDTTHQRNLEALKKETKQMKMRMDVLKDYMRRTYGRRRKWIMDGYGSVSEVCKEYPALKKYHIMVQEFEFIMKLEDSEEMFLSSWENWENAIIAYSNAAGHKSVGLKHALRDLSDLTL